MCYACTYTIVGPAISGCVHAHVYTCYVTVDVHVHVCTYTRALCSMSVVRCCLVLLNLYAESGGIEAQKLSDAASPGGEDQRAPSCEWVWPISVQVLYIYL